MTKIGLAVTEDSQYFSLGEMIRHDYAKARICAFCLLNPAKIMHPTDYTPATLTSRRCALHLMT